MRASIEKCKSWRGYKWAGRLIRECVKSLTTSYLVEFNVFDNQKESNPGLCEEKDGDLFNERFIHDFSL